MILTRTQRLEALKNTEAGHVILFIIYCLHILTLLYSFHTIQQQLDQIHMIQNHYTENLPASELADLEETQRFCLEYTGDYCY